MSASKCEICAKFGASVVLLPEPGDPRYPTGYSTNHLCRRCEDRAWREIKRREAEKKETKP